MIRMIALDLDGTTLADGGILTENTKMLLEQACERGIHIVVASGRSFYSLPEAIGQVKGLEYSINSNGSSVYRLQTGERIYHDPIREDRVEGILSILQEEGAGIECFVEGMAYASREFVENPEWFGATAQGRRYIQATRRPVEDICAFIRAHKTNLDAVDGVTGDPAQKRRLEVRLEELGGVYITSSVPHLVEIASATAGKASALRWLAARLDMRPEEIMACGNAENDRDMMAFAGLGVAVANSPQELLAAADYITEDNNHEGVAKAIRRFVLG